MVWSVLAQVLGCVVDRVVGARRAARAQDLELALPRHQVRLVPRRSPHSSRRSRWETLTVAVRTATLAHRSTGPRPVARATGDGATVAARGGLSPVDVPAPRRRRPTAARRRGRSTSRDVLTRRHVPPAPLCRQRITTWRQFLARHRNAVLACHFFAVETLFLKTG